MSGGDEKILYATTTSPLKLEVIGKVYKEYTVIGVTQNTFQLPEYPSGPEAGVMCARMRIEGARQEGAFHDGKYDAIISIESYVDEDMGAEMVCCIIETNDGHIKVIIDRCISLPQPLYSDFKQSSAIAASWGGYSNTFGQYMVKNGHCHDPKNWFGRRAALCLAVTKLKEHEGSTMTKQTIYAYLDYFKDYPKPGVLFTSLGSLMSHACNFKDFVAFMVEYIESSGVRVQYIIGLETRGIHIGAIIAHKLGVGFQMARKAGKLPNKHLLTTQYNTEYSKDAIEVAPLRALSEATSVLIVDDLIATGGSICAVAECIRQRYPGKQISCYAPLKVSTLESMARVKIEKEASIKWI